MEVKFKRRLVNELLTTYLPSFLLLGICYATTHFKAFYFEAAVTVNLTVMLVTTTLFIRLTIQISSVKPCIVCLSVMEKLPPTSYVRLVDIWLINGQLVPFIEVILLTALELQRGATSINHHGSVRLKEINSFDRKVSVRLSYKTYTSREVGNRGKPSSQAFVEVSKRRSIENILETTEEKILPVVFLIFAMIYWTYGLTLYFL